MKRACILLFTLATANVVMAQAPGVPVYIEGRGSRPDAALLEQAKKLQGESALLPMAKAGEQSKRMQCDLVLPPADTQPLASRERWQPARMYHIRVGAYL